jgi:hypothetical protein
MNSPHGCGSLQKIFGIVDLCLPMYVYHWSIIIFSFSLGEFNSPSTQIWTTWPKPVPHRWPQSNQGVTKRPLGNPRGLAMDTYIYIAGKMVDFLGHITDYRRVCLELPAYFSLNFIHPGTKRVKKSAGRHSGSSSVAPYSYDLGKKPRSTGSPCSTVSEASLNGHDGPQRYDRSSTPRRFHWAPRRLTCRELSWGWILHIGSIVFLVHVHKCIESIPIYLYIYQCNFIYIISYLIS